MSNEEKLAEVKRILRIEDDSQDVLLSTYLSAAKETILGWRYSYAESMPSDVPFEYENVQINAAVIAYTQSGIEGQTVSVENGIHRHFPYPDMQSYVKANVIAIAKVPGMVVSAP